MELIISTIRDTSQKYSDESLSKFRDKCQKLKVDPDRILTYLRNESDVIIHFKPYAVFPRILSDDRYRNHYDIRMTKQPNYWDSDREAFEQQIFGGLYDSIPVGDGRPKYGGLYLTKDPTGIQPLINAFGDCYFVLRRSILNRVTLVADWKRTCNQCKVKTIDDRHATPLFCCHLLLNYLSDSQLTGIDLVASGQRRWVSSAHHLPWWGGGVIMAVVHGSIILNQDIERIVAPKKVYYNNIPIRSSLEQLATKCQASLNWIE